MLHPLGITKKKVLAQSVHHLWQHHMQVVFFSIVVEQQGRYHPSTSLAGPHTNQFFTLPKMKTILKGKRFHIINDIKMNVTANLNAVLLNTINDSFVQFSERSKKIWCRDITLKKR